MAAVWFYEKAGCVNNSKQKKLLRLAGHTVVEKDLLTTSWRPDELMEYLSALPVADWFNRSAPQLKSGQIKPEHCSVEEAMALLINEPLLIRRPLMKVGTETMVGFDQERVDRWIGLQSRTNDDIETCPRSHDEGKVKKLRAES